MPEPLTDTVKEYGQKQHELGEATGAMMTATDAFRLLVNAGHFAAADLIEPMIYEASRKATALTKKIREMEISSAQT